MALPPPISAHRLVGQGRTAALIRPTAEIDWWCAPRFDSPPLLWSLLDRDGPRAEFPGARAADWGREPAGPTARTVLRVAGGLVEVWDGLEDDRLVRLVRALDGPVTLVHRCGLGGFDGSPRLPPVESRLAVSPEAWTAVVIDRQGVHLEDGRPLAEGFARAEAAAERRLSSSRLSRWHPERVRHALSVLHVCTYRPSGAIVASPTTSLPEAPGHDRQFDYRYAWLRDSSLAASIAAMAGESDSALHHLAFLRRLGGRILEAPVFDVGGEPTPEEREVDGARGWAGSGPVRVGNAAKHQLQYDALGFVVEAVAACVRVTGRLERDTWRLVRTIADRVCDGVEDRTSGIWELRRPGALVSADIGRWVALDRALRIARRRPWSRRPRWRRARRECRLRILSELRPDGRLPQVYGGPPDHLDASALLIPIMGLLRPGDPRASELVDAHLRRLGTGPFLYRYEPGGRDGFSGTEGAFVPCSWWVVSALATLGRVADAGRRADEMCAVLPALLSEEVDPTTGEGLGNTPLVWSHMELVRALHLLHAASIRRRWTGLGLALWRLGRFVHARLRRRGPSGEDRRVYPLSETG